MIAGKVKKREKNNEKRKQWNELVITPQPRE